MPTAKVMQPAPPPIVYSVTQNGLSPFRSTGSVSSPSKIQSQPVQSRVTILPNSFVADESHNDRQDLLNRSDQKLNGAWSHGSTDHIIILHHQFMP